MIKLYGKNSCGFCNRACELLKSKNIKFEKIEMGFKDEGFEKLYLKSNSKTLPQIYNGDIFIGGCDTLYDLDEKGKLDEKLS